MPPIIRKPPPAASAPGKTPAPARASPSEIAGWSAVAGKPLADVLSNGFYSKLGEINVDGYRLGIGARTASVVYPDGTTGTLAVTHAFKLKGERFPEDFVSGRAVEKALARAAEALAQQPGVIAHAGKWNSAHVPVHVAGIGQLERAWA